MSDWLFPTPVQTGAPTAGGRFAQVAVERGLERTAPSGAVDATLTYRADDPDLAVGDRVRVPLGRGDRPAEGIVVRLGGAELLAGLAAARVKPIAARTGASLPADLIDLATWLAQYYVCPLGMALAAMMPAAVKRRTGARTVHYVRPAPGNHDTASLSPAMRRAWSAIAALGPGVFPMTPKELAASLDRVSVITIRKLAAAGLLIESAREEVHSRNDPLAETAFTTGLARPTPTSQQAAIVAGITGSLGTFAVHLVRGVTGSGKTEVYLQAIQACRDRGQTAIVLVPEIALTPQTAGRFVERFGGQAAAGGPGLGVAVLHSGLTAAQRHAQWSACAAASVSIVVGARSAIFAPLPRLGLIVVDEEHDDSYKQDQLPRYHARDVAVKRAHLLGCPVVLGSATPSLESFANASDGRYRLWTLPDRVGGAALPRVEIVDLAQERRARTSAGGWRDRHFHLLGPRLESALAQTLTAGGQAILLLNRRGYANYICCPDARCGWVLGCDHCDVSLVFHLHARDLAARARSGGFVRCHHCLGEQLLPAKCPQCGHSVNTFGQGTQRVEEELERKFFVTHGLTTGEPDKPGTILRVDGDTMASAHDYFAALRRFAQGQARVMLGTQMIAKGLDFPNVRLVGVVNADTALNLPDFRASERTFQLVSQVAGRAGRGRDPGLVIVQTFTPAAPPIIHAARHDFESFARDELATRTRAGLPPAGRMARIVCRDLRLDKAAAAAALIHAALRTAIGDLGDRAGIVRLGPPTPCPIARIASHHRLGIELLAQTRGVIQAVLGAVRAKGLLKSDSSTSVDVDPVALM